MKSSEVKPLSHRIHALMYKKQAEIQNLYRRAVVPYHEVDRLRKELNKLEDKFARQVAWERANKKH